MELFWRETETFEYNDGGGLDLDDVWGESQVIDLKSFKLAIIYHIAVWCVEKGLSIDKVEGYTLDQNDELEISQSSTAKPWDWLDEVCKLYMHVNTSPYGPPEGAFLGYIKDVGWQFFNFDSGFKDVEDEYYQEFDGDSEEFAKEWMDNIGESIPDHMTYYFDYQAYGENLLEDYATIEWDGQEYLFTQ